MPEAGRGRRPFDDAEEGATGGRRPPAPHRGGMIVTFGVLGVALACLPVLGLVFGLLAARLGSADLLRMRLGTMDPAGRALTRTGRLLGFVGAALAAAMFAVACLLFVGALRSVR